MPGPIPKIYNHEEVVPKCNGCRRIVKCVNGRLICNCCIFPYTQWWFEEICPQATHINYKNEEDPIKEP
jgi:hypothetical protein